MFRSDEPVPPVKQIREERKKEEERERKQIISGPYFFT
jgi:hypothetical protein